MEGYPGLTAARNEAGTVGMIPSNYVERVQAGPPCEACGQAVSAAGRLQALGAVWHSSCFVCQACRESFPDGVYFVEGGRPYCAPHLPRSRCAACTLPVGDRAVTALGQSWHPEHFACAFCRSVLAATAYRLENSRPYCQSCFANLYPS